MSFSERPNNSNVMIASPSYLVVLPLHVLLLLLGLATACDHAAFAQGTHTCSILQTSCTNAVMAAATMGVRQQVLCSAVPGDPCADFVACVENQFVQSGCGADGQSPQRVLDLKAACTQLSALPQTCKDNLAAKESAKCGNPVFVWKSCENETELSLSQPEGFPYTVPTGTSNLPQSSANQLLTLHRISAEGCASEPVARSYDGQAWEGVMPAPLQPNCIAGTTQCST